MAGENKIFSVTEINQIIKNMMDSTPFFFIFYVRGELSNYKIYPSGHHYFSLKDPEGVLRCVMFRSSAAKLRFRPENGMKVILHGRITVFPRDGQYQLYCASIAPEGIGELAIAFEQLKVKLYQEGLFDEAHKKPLPRCPEKIALITSGSGAAVHDMIRILRKRYPVCKVFVLPVRVQGAEAPPEIAGAIRYANRWKIADLMITGRGGGSMEDLWAFNDERVARAIYASEIPVISAVGHEPDVTIADFVADARASTPSNAAELAVPDQMDLRSRIQADQARLQHGMVQQLRLRRERLQKLSASRVLRQPMTLIQDQRMRLDYIHQRLTAAARSSIAAHQQQFAALSAALDALSPLKVLSRGYAVAKDSEGNLLKHAENTAPGAQITVVLGHGALNCTVNHILKGEADALWQNKKR